MLKCSYCLTPGRNMAKVQDVLDALEGKGGISNLIQRYLKEGLPSYPKICDRCLDRIIHRYSKCRICGGPTECNIFVEFDSGQVQIYGDETSVFNMCRFCSSIYNQCGNCGRAVLKQLHHRESHCFLCYPSVRVFPYNYIPDVWQYLHHEKTSWTLSRNHKQENYFGLEFETKIYDNEFPNDTLYRDYVFTLTRPQLIRGIFAKHDGSIMPGFELVTYPTPFSSFQYNSYPLYRWMREIQKLNPDIRASTEESLVCGLHIHLSRHSLTPLLIYKMAAFCYTNYLNLTVIGGRQYNKYCQSSVLVGRDIHNGGYLNRGYLAKQVLREVDSPKQFRYFLLNLIPENTIEFRFFKAVYDIQRIKSYVEFVDSLTFFCREHPIGEVRFSVYQRWVEHHKKRYPNLAACLIANADKFADCCQSVYGIMKEKNWKTDYQTILNNFGVNPEASFWEDRIDELPPIYTVPPVISPEEEL